MWVTNILLRYLSLVPGVVAALIVVQNDIVRDAEDLVKWSKNNRDREFIMANWQVLGSIILPNAGGWLNGIYFAGQIRKDNEKTWYDLLKKPSWTPPKWVFGPAWTILYSGMGYASYLVWEECGGFTEDAVLPLSLYGGQLALNWAWTPIFFGLKDFKLAFIEISVLSGAAVATTISFFSVNKTAGLLLLPYLAWLGYASSLSYYIWKNNPQGKAVEDKAK